MITPNQEALAETAKRSVEHLFGNGTWERLTPHRQEEFKQDIWRDIYTYLTIMRQKDWLFVNINPPTSENTFQEPPSEIPPAG